MAEKGNSDDGVQADNEGHRSKSPLRGKQQHPPPPTPSATTHIRVSATLEGGGRGGGGVRGGGGGGDSLLGAQDSHVLVKLKGFSPPPVFAYTLKKSKHRGERERSLVHGNEATRGE